MIKTQVFQAKFKVTNGVQTYTIFMLYAYIDSGAYIYSET